MEQLTMSGFVYGFASAVGLYLVFSLSKHQLKKSIQKYNPYLFKS